MIPKLSTLPRVHRWQIGETEAAFWIAAGETEAIRAAAGLLRIRRRRPPETGRSAEALAAVRAKARARGAA
jgi:hypothetical protein